jgi:hypothetical protein
MKKAKVKLRIRKHQGVYCMRFSVERYEGWWYGWECLLDTPDESEAERRFDEYLRFHQTKDVIIKEVEL